MSEKPFDVWITKYALTEGIQKTTAIQVGPSMIQQYTEKVTGMTMTFYYHGEGREWHRTLDSALKRAEAMRVAKIKSLQAKIANLQRLNFHA